jgi:hypothetical protein
MRPVTPGRPPEELAPSTAPGGRPVPPDDPREMQALAALLAEVVLLPGDRAVFPSRWEHFGLLALEHNRVRAALLADGTRS